MRKVRVCRSIRYFGEGHKHLTHLLRAPQFCYFFGCWKQPAKMLGLRPFLLLAFLKFTRLHHAISCELFRELKFYCNSAAVNSCSSLSLSVHRDTKLQRTPKFKKTVPQFNNDKHSDTAMFLSGWRENSKVLLLYRFAMLFAEGNCWIPYKMRGNRWGFKICDITRTPCTRCLCTQ